MMSAQGGGEGGIPKADAVWRLCKGGCVKMQTGWRGQKIQNYFRCHTYCIWPHMVKQKIESRA